MTGNLDREKELIKELIKQAKNLTFNDQSAFEKLRKRARMILMSIPAVKEFASSLLNIELDQPSGELFWQDEGAKNWKIAVSKIIDPLELALEKLELFVDTPPGKAEISNSVFVVNGHDKEMENKAREQKPKRWGLIIPPVVAGIVLFFILPFLEKPRQTFLGLFGIKPRQEEPKPASSNPELPGPDPFKVVDEIGAAPLLQQDEVAKHYAGIQVDWTGKLASIEKAGGVLKLQVCMVKKLVESVCFFFEVNSADYPGIGLLKAGDKVRVRGYIKNVTAHRIILRDAKIIQYGN